MTRKLISIGYSLLAACALAQQDNPTRQLWNKAWLSQRPPGKPSTSAAEACVGITLWRLRPSRTTDDQYVRERMGDAGQQLTPVRVAAGAPLAEGEKVRISIETARNGYLYLLQRTVFAGGAKSEATLLFPATTHADNRLAPGGLLQIPGTSYFTLTRDRPDQVSETITVFILPEPIADPLNAGRFAEWEERWKIPVQSLDAGSQLGNAITRAELDAGRGRSTVLTQDDALPQTMFQCGVKTGEPLVVDVSLPIQKDSTTITRDLKFGKAKTLDTPPRSPAPAPKPSNPPFGRIGGIGGAGITSGRNVSRPARRVTASDFLVSSQTEKEGYGLYSYILFGARPESPGSDRWRRYYEAIVAYLDIPAIGEVSRSVPPESTNLTFLPLALAENELPAGGLVSPIQFRFVALRQAAHEALHKAGEKQFPYHDSTNGATACMLVDNYDYARAQGLLAVLPNSHMEGPYIISVTEPLSATRALPPQYLYQDLSSVPPELIRLWVKEFMAQAQENEFWKTRSKDQFVLRLRTAIGVMSQQIPDLGKSIAWTFISADRR
ncbi:MAG TPA: DUF4384 domain-containing protein [Bryobacteraceae bacterium]